MLEAIKSFALLTLAATTIAGAWLLPFMAPLIIKAIETWEL